MSLKEKEYTRGLCSHGTILKKAHAKPHIDSKKNVEGDNLLQLVNFMNDHLQKNPHVSSTSILVQQAELNFYYVSLIYLLVVLLLVLNKMKLSKKKKVKQEKKMDESFEESPDPKFSASPTQKVITIEGYYIPGLRERKPKIQTPQILLSPIAEEDEEIHISEQEKKKDKHKIEKEKVDEEKESTKIEDDIEQKIDVNKSLMYYNEKHCSVKPMEALRTGIKFLKYLLQLYIDMWEMDDVKKKEKLEKLVENMEQNLEKTDVQLLKVIKSEIDSLKKQMKEIKLKKIQNECLHYMISLDRSYDSACRYLDILQRSKECNLLEEECRRELIHLEKSLLSCVPSLFTLYIPT